MSNIDQEMKRLEESAIVDLKRYLEDEFEGRSAYEIVRMESVDSYGDSVDIDVEFERDFRELRIRMTLKPSVSLDSPSEDPTSRWKYEVNMYEDVWEEIETFSWRVKYLYMAIMKF